MPFFRVPFSGTLLVEADDPVRADFVGHSWTVPMMQATHGVKIQAVPPEIKAVEFCKGHEKVEDVTQELQKSIEKDREEQRRNPGGALIAKMFCNHNYYVGLQVEWESLEFERMRPKISGCAIVTY